MASSSYFGFGRKPGLNGNSIYFAMTEDFNDDTTTGGKVKELDEGSVLDTTKTVTSPVKGYTTTTRSDDYSKMNSSDGSNKFVPVAGINYIGGTGHKPVLPEKDKIIEILEGKDKNIAKKHIASMYATPTLNNCLGIVDNNWQNDDKGINKFKYEQQMDNVADNISKTMQYQQAESTYIGLPNLYNCINAKSQKYYYNIPSPIVEKYVIEGTKTDNEQTEHKIAEAKKTFKKIPNVQQFSSQDEYTTTFGNASETYTSYNFDITTTESEYAFNVS
ncbi:unnamed protein product [Wuchereria bancrofti]|uniref:Uncharacterized protein n=1 Tax=Wuchereria bancrofti TaxID=6293 RepID=A0A3P7DVY3_WUCBA|nr:unnamed protein product [Wuchereria bancrofti]